MPSGANVNESIKTLIRAGYNFTVDDENIRYKCAGAGPSDGINADAVKKSLGVVKHNKQRSIAYLKSLLTVKAVLAAIMPIEHWLLAIEVYNYKKEVEQEAIEIFENMDALNNYMYKNYLHNDKYELIHSTDAPGVFYLKVCDKQKYAQAADCPAVFTRLTPEEAAACPW